MSPLNPFFRQEVASEQRLVQDLVNEHLRMYGQEVYYMPRKYLGTDSIMRENILSRFDDAYPIEAYIANVEGFQGSGDLMTKFGIRVTDEATFIISKERFQDYISDIMSNVESGEDLRRQDEDGNIAERPVEGDLIYFPLTDSLFEIKFVEHENPFYQLGQLTTYELRCELFEYEQEIVDTGITEIDDNLADIGYVVTVVLAGAGVTATAIGGVRNGAVNELVLINDGYGYTQAPLVSISTSPNGSSNANATAVAISTIGAGSTTYSIQSLRITNTGFGYTEPPTVTIVGSGVGAKVRANIATEGAFYVQSFTGGSEYSGIPNVAISTSPVGVATANASVEAVVSSAGTVSALRIVNAGFGYTQSPTITFDAPYKKRPASDLTVGFTTAPVGLGTVTGVSIGDAGFGYTVAPTVEFSDPSGFSAGIITAVLANAGVGSTLSTLLVGIGTTIGAGEYESTGNGYGEVPTLTISDPSGFRSGIVTVGLTTVGLGTTAIENIALVGFATVVGTAYTGSAIITVGSTSGIIIGDTLTDTVGLITSGTSVVSIGTTGAILLSDNVVNAGVTTMTFSRETSVGFGTTVFDTVGFGSTVAFITLDNPGAFYFTAPTLTITGPSSTVGTTTATAEAFINSTGIITGVNLTNPGLGYSSIDDFPITVTLTGGIGTATGTVGIATSTGKITSATLTDVGFGYTTVPTITLNGGISTATGTAVISATGSVTGVTITNPGAGYTTQPTVSISLPNTPVNTGDYVYNEIVTGQTGLATALVKDWNATTRTLELYSVAGDLRVGEILAGSATTVSTANTSHTTANYFVESVSYENDDATGVDSFESNTEIQDAATDVDGIVDWTETNPFGTF